MSNVSGKVSKTLFILLAVMVLSAIAANYYIFYFQKSYDFSVEASCNQSEQSCFIRDCSDGECPPNELEVYRIFTIKASDFDSCSDNSCLNECTIGAIKCEEVFCDEEAGDTCLGKL